MKVFKWKEGEKQKAQRKGKGKRRQRREWTDLNTICTKQFNKTICGQFFRSWWRRWKFLLPSNTKPLPLCIKFFLVEKDKYTLQIPVNGQTHNLQYINSTNEMPSTGILRVFPDYHSGLAKGTSLKVGKNQVVSEMFILLRDEIVQTFGWIQTFYVGLVKKIRQYFFPQI